MRPKRVELESFNTLHCCIKLAFHFISLYKSKYRHNLFNNISSVTCFGFVSFLQSEHKIVVRSIYYSAVSGKIHFTPQLYIQPEDRLKSRNMLLLINY